MKFNQTELKKIESFIFKSQDFKDFKLKCCFRF